MINNRFHLKNIKKSIFLIVLVFLCSFIFSLEVKYVKEIEYGQYYHLEFCDNGENLIYESNILNLETEISTRVDFPTNKIISSVSALSMQEFGLFNVSCVSLPHRQYFLYYPERGLKTVSSDVVHKKSTNNRNKLVADNKLQLYGSSYIQYVLSYIDDSGDVNRLTFYESENKKADNPIEIKNSLGYYKPVSLTYDLFTGVFHQQIYWEGEGDPLWWLDRNVKKAPVGSPKTSTKIHVFKIIYNGFTNSEINVREAPSHDAALLGLFEKGTVVKVSEADNYEKRMGYQDYWYYIESENISGWVEGEHLLIEGSTWYDRFELRGPYIEWDDIPESENILIADTFNEHEKSSPMEEVFIPQKAQQNAFLNDSNVRLRFLPSLESEVLELLEEGEEVVVVAKTSEKEKIGDMESNWYKVNKVSKGGYPTGWVYGAFLDFPLEEQANKVEETEKNIIQDNKEEENIEEQEKDFFINKPVILLVCIGVVVCIITLSIVVVVKRKKSISSK